MSFVPRRPVYDNNSSYGHGKQNQGRHRNQNDDGYNNNNGGWRRQAELQQGNSQYDHRNAMNQRRNLNQYDAGYVKNENWKSEGEQQQGSRHYRHNNAKPVEHQNSRQQKQQEQPKVAQPSHVMAPPPGFEHVSVTRQPLEEDDGAGFSLHPIFQQVLGRRPTREEVVQGIEMENNKSELVEKEEEHDSAVPEDSSDSRYSNSSGEQYQHRHQQSEHNQEDQGYYEEYQNQKTEYGNNGSRNGYKGSYGQNEHSCSRQGFQDYGNRSMIYRRNGGLQNEGGDVEKRLRNMNVQDDRRKHQVNFGRLEQNRGGQGIDNQENRYRHQGQNKQRCIRQQEQMNHRGEYEQQNRNNRQYHPNSFRGQGFQQNGAKKQNRYHNSEYRNSTENNGRNTPNGYSKAQGAYLEEKHSNQGKAKQTQNDLKNTEKVETGAYLELPLPHFTPVESKNLPEEHNVKAETLAMQHSSGPSTTELKETKIEHEKATHQFQMSEIRRLQRERWEAQSKNKKSEEKPKNSLFS